MKKIMDGLILMELPFFQFPYCNCLFIEGEINCLIDSSPPPQDVDFLAGQKIDLIINSHGHVDHFHRNCDYPKAKVLLHQADHIYAADGQEYFLQFGFDIYFPELPAELFLNAIGYKARPADGTLEEGQILELGKHRIQVLHLPGHSAGHCGFWFTELGIMFTADIDLDRIGPWYGLKPGNIDDFILSIERVRDLYPEAIITGHGPSPITSDIRSKLAQYRDVIYQREQEIVRLLFRGKSTVWEIAKEAPCYGGRVPKPERVGIVYECMMVEKHLERLIRLGKVIREGERFALVPGVRPSNLNTG